MKNLNLKTCIFETFENFKKICSELFMDVENFDVDFDSTEGIFFCGIDNEAVNKRIADYYGVKTITSIHTDHFEETGVWICCGR